MTSDLKRAERLNALFRQWVEEIIPDMDERMTVEEGIEWAWNRFERGYLEIVYRNRKMDFAGCGYTRNERHVVRGMNRPIVEAWKRRRPLRTS